ncbi:MULTISPECIES: RHS repeat domain-containing protein [unclassified Streptomyces]|uniref:RHS repeat domain-containing protein n=1 Tax=unclassified Streptomyces TaxID=2593676 RepID=UPI002B1CDCC8|nr:MULTISPECIES: RHS repeat domain-containing protein [unclassified Streptomyces]
MTGSRRTRRRGSRPPRSCPAREGGRRRGVPPGGDAVTTSYGYTPSGQLLKVTDDTGNVWSYTYGQLGRKKHRNLVARSLLRQQSGAGAGAVCGR